VVDLLLSRPRHPGMTGAFYLLGDAIADVSDPRRRR
jgi:hypothetical protein